MFDTMTQTKLIGAFCGAWLILLLGGWVAETIYHSGAGGHGGEHANAYVIHLEDDDAVEEVVEEGAPFAELLASADPADGENLFRRNCAACHAVVAGDNGAGPYLHGVVDRPVGAAEGFGSYSGALNEVAEVWSTDELNAFILNPGDYAPGTSMGYRGMSDAEDRAALIAYLDATDD